MKTPSETVVIAEAGVNHNGDLQLAKKLVDAACDAGADVVKFQTFQASRLVTQFAEQAKYQQKSLDKVEGQLAMLKRLELQPEQHYELMEYCDQRNIEFLSTAFDTSSIELLASLKLKRWKVPSGEITNLPFLRHIGSQGNPVILSTGMATLGEIEAALTVLEQAGTIRSHITVLHCTTEYPAPPEHVNLRAMKTIAQSFGVSVGYSDHTDGIIVPIAAVAMGAILIEKHLTLDRSMHGPDHKASLEPDQFREMVCGIRTVEQAVGDGIKMPTVSEIPNKIVARKSLVASTLIKRGEPFTEFNVTCKRPGSGISPMHWDSLIGRISSRDYMPDELIEW